MSLNTRKSSSSSVVILGLDEPFSFQEWPSPHAVVTLLFPIDGQARGADCSPYRGPGLGSTAVATGETGWLVEYCMSSQAAARADWLVGCLVAVAFD